MAYGAEFRNELGELIVDDGLAMYERARGFSIKPAGIDGLAKHAFPTTRALITYVGGTDSQESRYLSTGTIEQIMPATSKVYVCPNQMWDYGDIGFYRLSDGGVYYYACIGHHDGTNEGAFHIIFHDQASSEIEYRIASVIPPSLPPEGYGLQTFSASGDVTFDSRHKQLPILKNLYVVAADIYTVLSTGVSKSIDIGMAIPDAWIATPQWTNFYDHYQNGSYNSSWAVYVAQVDDSTLEIRRKSANRWTKGWSDPDFASFTHDATILVAPPPPA